MEMKQTEQNKETRLPYEKPTVQPLGKLNTLIRGTGSGRPDMGCPGAGGVFCEIDDD